jgi:hypothetical protein
MCDRRLGPALLAELNAGALPPPIPLFLDLGENMRDSKSTL